MDRTYGYSRPWRFAHVVHHDRELGPRIGLLYGINTFGAVAGTLAAAFLLLPNLGLKRTTWVGAAVNLAIFAIIYFLVCLFTSLRGWGSYASRYRGQKIFPAGVQTFSGQSMIGGNLYSTVIYDQQ